MKSATCIASLRHISLIPVCLFLLLFTAIAQDKAEFETEFRQALQLVQANKFGEALPKLEKLNAAQANHPAVMELLALCLFSQAAVEKNEELRVKGFQRARQTAERAKQAGNNSDLIALILEKVPADGKLDTLAGEKKRTPAEEALMEGESAFASGQLDKAIEQYERALKLDPKLYDAPLFIGDAYYKMGKIDKAGENYARAIAIDPDRETGYRYWGNVLLREGRLEEAREKLIDAVIAAPYFRATWQFLANWGQRAGVELGHPRIDIPKSSVTKKDDKVDVTAFLSEKKDGSAAWTAYSLSRASWLSGDEKFKAAYPKESQYRHSLAEEIASLNLAVESVKTQLKDGTAKESALDVSIANLLQLHKEGLLEAYILFAMADQGISKDYPEYRKTNREKLRKYLTEYVTAKR